MVAQSLGGGVVGDVGALDERWRYAVRDEHLGHAQLLGLIAAGPPLGEHCALIQRGDASAAGRNREAKLAAFWSATTTPSRSSTSGSTLSTVKSPFLLCRRMNSMALRAWT
jgi:hypothetical protein